MEELFDAYMFHHTWETIVEMDNSIVGTYYIRDVVENEEFIDHLMQVKRIALDGSTSSWESVSEDTPELRERLTSKVIGYYEIPSSAGSKQAIIQLAYPVGAWGVPITTPMVLTVIAGTHMVFPTDIKLLDLYFSKSIADQFKGPKFGINGIRELLNVYDRPLVMHVIKPKMGMTPIETANQVYETAMGGVDIIKDDEMTVEFDNCPFEARLEEVSKALVKAEKSTGKKSLYMISISDEINRVLDRASYAVKNGATGLLLTFSAGLSTIRVLAEDPNITIPIMLHPSHAWALLPKINFPTISKLGRICGADFIHSPTIWSIHPASSPEECYRCAHVLRAPLYNIRSTFPQPIGGIYPGTVEALIGEYGKDIVIAAGGGILGHPMGYRAGAVAMRQAIESVISGISLNDALKDSNKKELQAALQKWGIRKRKISHWGYLGKEYNPKTAAKNL